MFEDKFVAALSEMLDAIKKLVITLRDLQRDSPEEYDKFVDFSTDPTASYKLVIELSKKDPSLAGEFLDLVGKMGELQKYLSRIYFTDVDEKETAIALIEDTKKKLRELEELLEARKNTEKNG